jgi:16S rRNA (cytosine967-C5)-methyltransferase
LRNALLNWRDVMILVHAVKAAEEVKPSQQAKRDVFRRYGVLGTERDPLLTSIFYRVMMRQGVLDKMIKEATGVNNVLLLDAWLRAALRLFMEVEVFSKKWVSFNDPYQVRRRVSAFLSRKAHPYVGMWFFDVSWGLRRFRPRPKSWEEELELKYLLPSWYVKRITDLIGREEAEKYFESLNRKPKLSVRVTHKGTVDEVMRELRQGGVKNIEVSNIVPKVVRFEGPFDFDSSKAFLDGKFIIQEESAALAAILLDPRPGDFVVDLAAAPGGKTELIGELMMGEGVIHAYDIDGRRVERMKELLSRTGIHNVVIHVKDGRVAPAELGKGVADRVLVDAPCSSDGTIMKNPDLRWRLMEDEVPKFTQIQYELLKAGLKLLKAGGIMLYSTCSMLKDEDEDVVSRLLSKEGRRVEIVELRGPYEPGFLEGTMRAWPHKHPTIGFFYAKIRKVR